MATEPFVDIPGPKTKDQGKRIFSNDKIKNLTKQKVQEYIESFFEIASRNNDLLSAVSPHFINYNTSKSFDPKTDPTQRKIQIARYFDELKNVIPSIVIADGGVNVVPQTIGHIGDSLIKDGNWHGFYPIVRRIPLSIIAVGGDVDQADSMSGLLSLMFNEMRNIACGQYITGNQEQGESWVVSLPNAPVDIGPLADSDIQGDPIKKIWYTETTLDVYFEDTLAIKQKLPTTVLAGDLVNESNTRQTLAPIIEISDTINLNEQAFVFIRNIENKHRVILSDSKIATITHDLKITPRKLGKVKIQVVDPFGPPDSRLVAEKEIEIV